MIRRVYLDFLKDKIAGKEVGWLLKRGSQYMLTHLSFGLRRALCGPILGTFVTNYSCNYRCKMCDLPLKEKAIKDKGLSELSAQQLKGLLEDFSILGVSGVGFTGGEPLLRADIFELLSYAKSLGMITHLNTNGFFLDDAKIREILNAGVDSINISLDGASPQTHNAIRGSRGAFEKVVSAVDLLNIRRKENKSNIRLKVVSVISEENIDEVAGLLSLAQRLKTDCVEFIPQQNFLGAGYADPVELNGGFLERLKKSLADIKAFSFNGLKVENSRAHLDLFERSFRNQGSPLKCYAGYNSCAVDCYGQIYPCVPWVNWGRPVGNIRDMELKDFWYSDSYRLARKEISQCRACYLNCQAELNLLFNPAALLN